MKKYFTIVCLLFVFTIFAAFSTKRELKKHEPVGSLLHVLQRISLKYQKTIAIESNINIEKYKFTLTIKEDSLFDSDLSTLCDKLEKHRFYKSNDIIYIVQDDFRNQKNYILDKISNINSEEGNKIKHFELTHFYVKNRIIGSLIFYDMSFASNERPWYVYFPTDKDYSKLLFRELAEDSAKNEGIILWVRDERTNNDFGVDLYKKHIEKKYNIKTTLPFYFITGFPGYGYKIKKERQKKEEKTIQKPKVITEKDIPKRGNHLVDVKLKIIDVIINEKSNSYFEITLKNKSKEKLFFKDMFTNLKVHNWACPYSGKGYDILCLFYPPKEDIFIKENISFELNIDEEKILKFPIVGSRMQLDVAPSWFDDKSNGRTRDEGKEYKEYLSITPNFQMECKKVYPGNSFKAIIRFYDKNNIFYKAFEKKNIPFYPKTK